MEFLSKVRSARDEGTLLDLLVNRARTLGFGAVAYYRPAANDHGRIHVQARGYPDEWIERYERERLYVIDPHLAYVAQSGESLQFDRITEKRELTEKQVEFLGERAEAGLTDGYLVPAFGTYPTTTFGVIPLLGWIAFGQVADDQTIADTNVAYLEAIAQATHVQANRLRRGRGSNRPRLSPREVAILNWISRGKTNADIATILEIAVPTVATYVRRMFKKLDVEDRASAAVKGMRLGFIPH